MVPIRVSAAPRIIPTSDGAGGSISPDLRGYGDSSKPPDGENHANYSKRAMALDQVEGMRQFGFEKFPVIATIAAAA